MSLRNIVSGNTDDDYTYTIVCAETNTVLYQSKFTYSSQQIAELQAMIHAMDDFADRKTIILTSN